MATPQIDPLALAVARRLFGFGFKSTALAAMVCGVLPVGDSFFGVETPHEDYLRVSDGYTRALSM